MEKRLGLTLPPPPPPPPPLDREQSGSRGDDRRTKNTEIFLRRRRRRNFCSCYVSLIVALISHSLSHSRPPGCPALSPVSPTSRFRPSRRAPTFALFPLPSREPPHHGRSLSLIPVISRVRAVDMNRRTLERVFVQIRDSSAPCIYDLRERSSAARKVKSVASHCCAIVGAAADAVALLTL